jgi:hypothetical protein
MRWPVCPVPENGKEINHGGTEEHGEGRKGEEGKRGSHNGVRGK